MFQNSEASSATTIDMGSVLALYLVGNLIGVPTFGSSWHGWIQKVEVILRESLAMVLSVKGLDRGLWGKCTTSREYCNLIDQPSSRKRTLEHLKDGSSEGSSSLFPKQSF